MPKTMLTVATRKGTFILESDDRRDWTLRGPYCEGWPVYHAIYDPTTGDLISETVSAEKGPHPELDSGGDFGNGALFCDVNVPALS